MLDLEEIKSKFIIAFCGSMIIIFAYYSTLIPGIFSAFLLLAFFILLMFFVSMFDLKEVQDRIITAFIGTLIIIFAYFIDLTLGLFSSILLLILYSEMLIACYISQAKLLIKTLVFICGLIYLALGIESLVSICRIGGNIELMSLFFTIGMIDVSAYIFGKIIKGPLLAPMISPRKTIAGFFGGVLVGGIFFDTILLINVINHENLLLNFVLSILFASFVQFGDLLISFAKRNLELKDSSNLLPGHGGFWDRCDSLLAGAIFFNIFKIIVELRQ